MENKNKPPEPPRLSPFIFTFLLLGFGLWCFYDGWLNTDPEMLKHATFNRILSLILLPWGVYDFFKIRKHREENEKPDN